MKTPRKGNKAEGQRLKAARLERGQTRTEAAFHAGISAVTMSMMESGHLAISNSSLVKLAASWKIPFEKLMRRIRG